MEPVEKEGWERPGRATADANGGSRFPRTTLNEVIVFTDPGIDQTVGQWRGCWSCFPGGGASPLPGLVLLPSPGLSSPLSPTLSIIQFPCQGQRCLSRSSLLTRWPRKHPCCSPSPCPREIPCCPHSPASLTS